MADPKKRRKVTFEALALKPAVEEATTEPSAGQKVAGDVTRTIGERARGILPLIARGAGGVLSFEGGPVGAGVAGGSEILAQMLEGRKWDDINWGHVGVEGALGLVPAGKMFKAGKAMASAARGAGISAAGVVGRKAADVATGENPNALNKENWSAWDALPVVLGAGMSGALGKFTKTAVPRLPTTPEGPATIDDFLGGNTWYSGKSPKWDADRIGLEASRLDAAGQKEAAHGVREASLRTNTGDKGIYDTITKSNEANAAQTAKNANAGAGMGRGQTIESVLAQGPKAVEDVALRLEAAGHSDQAAILRQAAVSAGISAPATSRAVSKATKEAEKAATAARQAELAKTRLEDLQAAGGQTNRKASESVKAIDPETGEVTTVVDVTAVPPKKGGAADGGSQTSSRRGAIPLEPIITAKPDVFQVISDTGLVKAEVPTLKDAEEAMSAFGSGHRVVFPANFKPTAGAEMPGVKANPDASIKVIAPDEVGLRISSKDAPPTPFNPPRIVEPPVKAPNEAPTSPVEPVQAPPATPPLPELPKAPSEAPMASTAVPGGGVLARFFRSPQAATAEGEYAAQLPITDKALPQINPLLAQNDVLTKAQRAAREPDAPARVLGRTLQKAGKELGLPPRPKPIRQEADALQQEILDRTLQANRGTPADVPSNPIAQALERERIAVPSAAPMARPDVNRLARLSQAVGTPDLEKAVESRLARAAEAGEQIPPASPQMPQAPITPSLSDPADIVAEFTSRKAAAKTPEEVALLEKEAEGIQSNLIQDALRKAKGESGEVSPELLQALATRGLPTVAGASIGAAVDDKNRLRGAMLGGAAGFAGSSAIQGLTKGTNLQLGPRAVNWQRGSMLSAPRNLIVNTAASTGSGNLSSMEKMLQGLFEKAGMSPESGALDLGKSGLREMWSPERIKSIPEDWRKAGQRLDHTSERADLSNITDPNIIDTLSKIPALIMTFGDDNVRTALIRAGWSEAQARAATLTSEPRYALTKQLPNIARSGGTAGRLALPFSKTAANVIESSLERTPVIGLLLGMTKDSINPALKASLSEIAARQGMGAAVSAASYMLGKTIDPETAKTAKWFMMITNMSGQYGALAGAAFAAGQAAQSGAEPLDQLSKGGSKFLQSLPLPTTEVFDEMKNAAISYAKGEPPNPNAEHLPQRWLPDNMLPKILKDDAINTATDLIPKRRVKFEGLNLP